MTRQGTNAMPTHETLYPPTADRPVLGPQRGLHARGTVAPRVGGMDAPGVAQKLEAERALSGRDRQP